MNIATATVFVSGMLAMGYAMAALFFLKFWRQTRDRLFLYFIAAFVLLFAQRVALSSSVMPDTDTLWFYVVRLLAFSLIIVAIVDKNRSRN